MSWQFAYTLEVAILIWNQRNLIFSSLKMISKNMNLKLATGVKNLIFLDVFKKVSLFTILFNSFLH